MVIGDDYAAEWGKIFGSWQIREKIGKGSNGRTKVYRITKDAQGGMEVGEKRALKAVTICEDANLENMTANARAEYDANRKMLIEKASNEIFLMKRLEGAPHIVGYLDWEIRDRTGGTDLLIAMHLLETLEQGKRQKDIFPEEDVLEVGIDICKALVRCQEEGIIHRDIKPANIFRRPDGKGGYMLGDFGISRILDNDMGASTEIGTPAYAAPEQVRMGSYDSRVDIYSLGVVLYEMSNRNRLPFAESRYSTKEIIERRLIHGEEIPVPSDASPALASVILKACAFRQECRFQTAEEFLDALEELRNGKIAKLSASDVKSALELDPYATMPVASFVQKEETFGTLMERLISQPGKGDDYKNAFNGNKFYNIVEDFQHIKNEAQQGSVEAMYELANMYFYGMADDEGGSARNYSRAYEWFVRLAECSVAEYRAYAKNMIGHMLYSGTAPMQEQSYEKALALHMEAADTISPLGAHVGYMLSVGSGCEFSLPEIEKYYMRLAEKDTLAELNLARLYKDHGMFDKAGAVYRQMWGRSAQAAYELGLLYKRGVLTEPHKPDYFQASFYFMQATQTKDCVVDAYYQLATLYFNPTGGFPKNFEKAEELFKIAADKGHCEAQYNLAYMYENGHIQQDLKKAVYYHELAAKQGEVMSMASLANLYQQPICRDYGKAFQYAQMAAKHGSAMGAFIYANLCFIGRGTSPNINEAYRYYRFAHDHGFFQAGFMIKKLEQMSIY